MKYAARSILCRFKQYLSVKLWGYCYNVTTRLNTNNRGIFNEIEELIPLVV